MQIPFISNAVAEALLLCFLHSLWIGSLAALIAALVMHLPGHQSRLRYHLLVFILGLFGAANGFIIFNKLFRLTSTTQNSFQTTELQWGITQLTGSNDTGIFNSVSAIHWVIQSYSSWLILFWMIVMLYKSIRLVTGYSYLLRLKNQSLPVTEPEWINRLNHLANKAGIRKNVQLRWSSAHTVPMVIGILKPVIILPVAVINSLSASSVEAILLHELSHIRRRDFLVNLLQECMEIIFFFNPAVIWISSCIRRERENCCDDEAIAISQDKLEYVNALVAFQEYHIRRSGLTTGFPGRGNHLFHRVNRIVSNRNKSMNNMEKFLLASFIILGCAATAAFSKLSAEDKEKNKARREILSLQSPIPDPLNVGDIRSDRDMDTLPPKIKVSSSPLVEYKSEIDGKSYTIVEKNGKVYTMTINGKNVDSRDFDKHKPVIERIRKEISKEQERELELLNREHGKLMEQELKLKSLQDELMKKSRELQLNDEFNDERIDNIREEALQSAKEEQLRNMLLYQKEMQNAQNELQEQLKQLKKNELRQYELLLKQEKERLHQEKFIYDSLLQKEYFFKHQELLAEQAKHEEIVKFLINEGVIDTANNLTFSISDESLIINGEKQPETLHKRMIEKFFSKTGRPFKFSYHY